MSNCDYCNRLFNANVRCFWRLWGLVGRFCSKGCCDKAHAEAVLLHPILAKQKGFDIRSA